MTRSAYLTVASLAALYLFWLATWLVFGAELHGSARQYWSQAAAAAVTAPRRSLCPAFTWFDGGSFRLSVAPR
jgi:hypothetical protein